MQPTDDKLVEECLAGNTGAFQELVERHQKRVYSLALRITGNPADAEDLAQEAFVRAYLSLPRYKGSGRFGAWLCRITYNLCLNAIRNGHRTVAVDPTDFESLRADASSHKNGSAVERSRAVRTAIQSLEENYRGVVVLRFMEGLSYAEIAEVLGVPVSTIETRLHRAKKRLRELLKEWI